MGTDHETRTFPELAVGSEVCCGSDSDVRCLPRISHHALAGVAARHVGELAFARRGRRPAVHSSGFGGGRDSADDGRYEAVATLRAAGERVGLDGEHRAHLGINFASGGSFPFLRSLTVSMSFSLRGCRRLRSPSQRRRTILRRVAGDSFNLKDCHLF